MREMSIEEREAWRDVGIQAEGRHGRNRGSGARRSRNQRMANTLAPNNRSVLGVDGH